MWLDVSKFREEPKEILFSVIIRDILNIQIVCFEGKFAVITTRYWPVGKRFAWPASHLTIWPWLWPVWRPRLFPSPFVAIRPGITPTIWSLSWASFAFCFATTPRIAWFLFWPTSAFRGRIFTLTPSTWWSFLTSLCRFRHRFRRFWASLWFLPRIFLFFVWLLPAFWLLLSSYWRAIALL